MNVPIMLIGASLNWANTDSPVESSAPKAATKASMARRPLINSGAPENAITSPNPGAFGSGIGVDAGGVVVCTDMNTTWEGPYIIQRVALRASHGGVSGQPQQTHKHTSSATAAAGSATGVDSGSSGEAANTLVRDVLFTWVEDATIGDLLIKETFGARAYIVTRLWMCSEFNEEITWILIWLTPYHVQWFVRGFHSILWMPSIHPSSGNVWLSELWPFFFPHMHVDHGIPRHSCSIVPVQDHHHYHDDDNDDSLYTRRWSWYVPSSCMVDYPIQTPVLLFWFSVATTLSCFPANPTWSHLHVYYIIL